MPITIDEFQKAAANGGIIRAQPDNLEQLRSTSANSLWKRLRGQSKSEKSESAALRVALSAALEQKYGKAFVESVADKVDLNSTRPLLASTVNELMAAGKAHLDASIARVNSIAGRLSGEQPSNEQASFANIFAQKANELGFNHPLSEMNVAKLQHAISHKITSEGAGGRNFVSEADARKMAEREIEKYIKNKMALEQKAGDMNLSPAAQKVLIDFAMSHDTSTPAALEQAWKLSNEAQKMSAAIIAPGSSRVDCLKAVGEYQKAYDSALLVVAQGVKREDFGADDVLNLNSDAIELCMKVGFDNEAAKQVYDKMSTPGMQEIREAAVFINFNSEELAIGPEANNRMRNLNETLGLIARNAGGQAQLSEQQIHDGQHVPDNLQSIDGVSPYLMSDLHNAGINVVQFSEARIKELQAAERAELPGLSDQKSAIGKSAEDLVNHLDEQNGRLRNLQSRDYARLQTLPPGEGRNALQTMIDDRATTIKKNDEFIERLYHGEHPTLVMVDMVEKKAILVSPDSLQSLTEAKKEIIDQEKRRMEAEDVDPQALAAEQQEELNLHLNPSSAALSKPPPTTLPPLPGEGPPSLERSPSVRDLLKSKGAVANNPFKVQDDALKADKQANPKESTGHALSSHKPSGPAPKPASLKPGGL